MENWEEVLVLVTIMGLALSALLFYGGAWENGKMRKMRTLRKPRRSTSNLEEWRAILQTV